MASRKPPLNPSITFSEFRRYRDFFGRTDDRDPKKSFASYTPISGILRVRRDSNEEANEFPELAVVFGISFTNDVAHDGIVLKRRAKNIQGGDLVTAVKIAQGNREFLRLLASAFRNVSTICSSQNRLLFISAPDLVSETGRCLSSSADPTLSPGAGSACGEPYPRGNWNEFRSRIPWRNPIKLEDTTMHPVCPQSGKLEVRINDKLKFGWVMEHACRRGSKIICRRLRKETAYLRGQGEERFRPANSGRALPGSQGLQTAQCPFRNLPEKRAFDGANH